MRVQQHIETTSKVDQFFNENMIVIYEVMGSRLRALELESQPHQLVIPRSRINSVTILYPVSSHLYNVINNGTYL